MHNPNDEPMDIKTNLEDFPNISQQRKKVLKVEDDTVFQPGYDNLFIGQEEYRKGWEMKGSKTQDGC